MKTALDPRHKHRQTVVKELFSWQFHHQPVADETTKKVLANVALLDQLITKNAPEFPLDRINGTDLAILRLAVYELVVFRTEPPKAVIDEAVELGKEFGSDNAASFINGVLGKVLVSPERTTKIIADHLGVEEEHLTRDSLLREDLNAESLEITDLLAALEKDLHLEIAPETHLASVGDILDYIEDHHE